MKLHSVREKEREKERERERKEVYYLFTYLVPRDKVKN